MSGRIQFYTNPMSRGRIARWALHEAGADYDEHLVSYGPQMKGDYRKTVNPMGKVPAIVHRGAVVTEAAAICLYLAEAFPEAGLLPQTLAEKADYLRLTFLAAGPLDQAVIARSFKWDEGLGPQERRRTGFGSYEDVVDTLAVLLSDRDYVCGDRFTAADIYVGAQVNWGMMFDTLPERPQFMAYAERIRARPAYKAAAAIDADHIAAMQKEG